MVAFFVTTHQVPAFHSEYVAILSGNTDLLAKVKLEKKIAALESEKQAFSRSKWQTKQKYDDIVCTVDANKEMISRINSDWHLYNSRIQLDAEGNKLNPIQLNGGTGSDPKAIGAKLSEINEKARTHGEDFEIGSLYDFKIIVKTESSSKDLFELSQNKFFIKGDSGIKYSHNNGKIAEDPKLATLNFLNALEHMPNMLEQYKTKTEKLEADIPVLENILKGTWRKEDELHSVKSELATLDRQIQLSLTKVSQAEESTKQIEEEFEQKQDSKFDSDQRCEITKQEQKIFLVQPTNSGIKH